MSTINWQKSRDYFQKNLKLSTIKFNPYWHLEFVKTLDTDLLHNISVNWPVKWSPDTRSPYRKVYMVSEHSTKFWREFKHEFVNKIIFDRDMPKFNNIEIDVWEDSKGYAIGNHVDTYPVQMTWQIYIEGSCGTAFTNNNGVVLKTIPFAPNRGYITKVDDNSWHKLDKIDCNIRKSIMCRFMTTERSQ